MFQKLGIMQISKHHTNENFVGQSFLYVVICATPSYPFKKFAMNVTRVLVAPIMDLGLCLAT
jgi:hypothetical protein